MKSLILFLPFFLTLLSSENTQPTLFPGRLRDASTVTELALGLGKCLRGFPKFPLLPFSPASAEILRWSKTASISKVRMQTARWDQHFLGGMSSPRQVRGAEQGLRACSRGWQ